MGIFLDLTEFDGQTLNESDVKHIQECCICKQRLKGMSNRAEQGQSKDDILLIYDQLYETFCH